MITISSNIHHRIFQTSPQKNKPHHSKKTNKHTNHPRPPTKRPPLANHRPGAWHRSPGLEFAHQICTAGSTGAWPTQCHGQRAAGHRLAGGGSCPSVVLLILLREITRFAVVFWWKLDVKQWNCCWCDWVIFWTGSLWSAGIKSGPLELPLVKLLMIEADRNSWNYSPEGISLKIEIR